MFLRRFIGDRAFYRKVLSLVLPVTVQCIITNFVSMLDNLMVGRVGTLAMGAVSVANQLIFVFNVIIFGATSGSGIFTAQFVGAGDHEGVRYTFRFKVYICGILTVLGAAIFLLWGRNLAALYVQGDGDPAEAAQTLDLALEYLLIMTIGLFPFAIGGAYSSTLRENGQTVVPMVASISAVVTNTVLNYVLIFGKLGAPAMGVRGAAIATVISRFVEMGIVAGWTHCNPKKNPFIVGALRSAYIPGWLLRDISKKGLPLLLNETIFSSGNAIITQCYSTRGLEVLPALNIVGMLQQLSHIAFSGFGNATAVILGQDLGAGKSKQEVMDTNWKLVACVVVLSMVSGVFMASLSGVFPLLYNTSQEVRNLATRLTLVQAVMVIFNACSMVFYYSIRSGGKMLQTIMYDSVPIWAVGVVLVTTLSWFTDVSVVVLYFAGNLMYVFKSVYGTIIARKGDWVQNLVAKK